MDKKQHHDQIVNSIQKQIQGQFLQKNAKPVSLQFRHGNSNTTRSKSYKASSARIDFTSLNKVLYIDSEKRLAVVEPRVTMEELVQATLPLGLIPQIVPEFKGITVGGAIMGGAAESSSHQFGIFHDTCNALEIICGDSTLLRLSPHENSDVFYGISGSYGTLGALVLAEIKLIPAKECVHLQYHIFSRPKEAIDFIRMLSFKQESPDFIDGMVFRKDLFVVIEGRMQKESHAPLFTLKPYSSEWYFQHVDRIANEANEPFYEEKMDIFEYLFRYDQGAFWMGGYLHEPLFLRQFIKEGILKKENAYKSRLSEDQIQRLNHVPRPNIFFRTLFHPFMTSQSLWKFLHRADDWVNNQVIIQDFCIPENKASSFLEDVLSDPGVYPLWLCPIKSTKTPQIFAPHLKQNNFDGHFINIGVYGFPSYIAPIEDITHKLEIKTKSSEGRKVMYSRSFYTQDEFWQIYSKNAYEALRQKTSAKGIWHEITEKLLSK